MRTDSVSPPDPLNGGFAHSDLPRERAGGPRMRLRDLGCRGGSKDQPYLGLGDRGGATRSRSVLQDSCHPVKEETAAPSGDGSSTRTKFERNLLVARALRGAEDDSGSTAESIGGPRILSEGKEFSALSPMRADGGSSSHNDGMM